ncbi:MAG: hypothetical protein ABIA63_08445, partial [bacterium]
AGLLAGFAAITRTEYHIWSFGLCFSYLVIYKHEGVKKLVSFGGGYFLIMAIYYYFKIKSEQGLPPFYAFNIFSLNFNKLEFVKPTFLETLQKYIFSILVYLFGTRFLYSSSPFTYVMPVFYTIAGLFLFFLRRKHSKLIWGMFLFIICLSTIFAISSKYISGLLTTFPLSLLMILIIKRIESQQLRFLGLCALTGALLTMLSGHTAEYCWGPRFLLPLFPLGLLVLLNLSELKADKALILNIAFLAFLGFVIQMEGILYKPYYMRRMLKNELAYIKQIQKNTLYVLNNNDSFINCHLILTDPEFYFQNKIISADMERFSSAQRRILFSKIKNLLEIDSFIMIVSNLPQKIPPQQVPGFSITEEQDFHYFGFYKLKRDINLEILSTQQPRKRL